MRPSALIHKDLEGARRRLTRLRAFSDARYQLRAAYLAAVLEVSAGNINAAQAAFAEIAALKPHRFRTEEEDDARTLAALQLARVQRERGEWEAALDAYREIPPRSQARAEALLEAAVTAAHLGDLGAAANYLEALEAHDAGGQARLELHRLRASLAMLDDDGDKARVAFQQLTRLGAEARTNVFGGGNTPTVRLEDDPSLGGLVDATQAERLLSLAREVSALEAELEANETAIATAQEALATGGGPYDRALERLREADALLRRAEGLISQRLERGVKVAGPATSARITAARAATMRKQLDVALAGLLERRGLRRARIAAVIDEAREDASASRRLLTALRGEVQATVAQGKKALVEQALGTVHRLEMSEDVGELELAWRAKNRATQEADRLRQEKAEAMATLRSDEAVE